MARRAMPRADWELIRKDVAAKADITSAAGGAALPAQGFQDRSYPGTRTKVPSIDDTADNTETVALPRKAACACEDKAKCACQKVDAEDPIVEANEAKEKASPNEDMNASVDTDFPGMMVALLSPRELNAKIAQPNGTHPDDMHVTLGYYGKVGKDIKPEHVQAVTKCVAMSAEGYKPIKAHIGGVGRFNATHTSEGKDVLIAHVDSPGLHEMRDHLIEHVRKCADIAKSGENLPPKDGLLPKADHGYTPHITLAYIDQAAPMPLHKLDRHEFTFTHLMVACGKDRKLFPLGESNVAKSIWCPIVKADDSERLATGIVLQPEVVDAQGDIIGADVIKQTAHNFLALYNKKTQLGLQHEIMKPDGVQLVESWIAPVDMILNNRTIKQGTWMMTVRVLNDAIWNGIKSGQLNGFSIGGVAKVQRLVVA